MMRTIWWEDEHIALIDQTVLPERLEIRRIGTVSELCEAIVSLKVRGAPALGAAGAYGVALACHLSRAKDEVEMREDVLRAASELKSTRPTATNLFWAIDRVLERVHGASDMDEMRTAALHEAERLAHEDVLTNRQMGRVGAELLEDGDVVLTHCNAGALACVDWGTALGVIRWAVLEQGKDVSVVACETRPLNQGSRLTTWELMRDGIDVMLICDSAACSLMRAGKVSKVLVGADRITRDAVFNKIGTYTHSVCAKEHAIPFYIAAPLSTFDISASESDVVVEQRDGSELVYCGDRRLAPENVRVYNPAFDATPMENITAIITERGVLYPPLSTDGLP
ncbi:MAG: S-methyl-5-thioribose-1-phosphate isomerase [Methermicoccaceae archaeon]